MWRDAIMGGLFISHFVTSVEDVQIKSVAEVVNADLRDSNWIHNES